jgi:hypothetical protein
MTDAHTAAPAGDTVRPAPELDIARKIWLAGVGAYDRISAETQGVVEKLASTASGTFEELVAHGEKVEDRVRSSLGSRAPGDKTNPAPDPEQRSTLEARLAKVRDTVAETLAPWNLPAIGQALEKLAAKVDSLSHEVAALKAARTEKSEAN